MTTAPLRWWDLGDTSRQFQVLHPAPAGNRGFTERGRYGFEKPGDGWELRVDDEPLADAAEERASWVWEPGFFAGEVTAELVGPAEADRALFLLDVSPDPSKVGREMFAQMLEDLRLEAPELLFGSEPATARIGDLGQFDDPWLAFSRFRRYCPDVLRALSQVRVDPRRTLRVERTSAPLHHARRVDKRTALSLARSPAVALLLDDAPTPSRPSDESRLDVPFVEETFDCAANRTLMALVLALIRRAVSLAERLQDVVDRDQASYTRTLLWKRWPVRLRILDVAAARFKLALRRPPFAEVARAEVTAAGLTAVAADPVYARVWDRGWRALRPGVEGGDGLERLWVSPSWEIYERWCFVRLGQALRTTMPEWGWTRRGNRWTASCGERRAALILQPTFPSRASTAPGPWSISKERIPDLLLRVDSSEGTRFIILDAKYRTSRSNVLDAMASAHIYQDSLRIGSVRPTATLLIVPSGGGAPWLEDVKFHASHRVGVHVLSPASTVSLPAMILDSPKRTRACECPALRSMVEFLLRGIASEGEVQSNPAEEERQGNCSESRAGSSERQQPRTAEA